MFLLSQLGEHCAAALQLITTAVSLATLIKKLRCQRREDYQLALTTEVVAYLFFGAGSVWGIFYAVATATNELAKAGHLTTRPCNVSLVAYISLNNVYCALLAMLMIDRLHTAFRGTVHELSDFANTAMRGIVVVVWSAATILLVLSFLPYIDSEHCIVEQIPEALQSQMMPCLAASLVFNLLTTLALWMLFISKMFKFHRQLQAVGARAVVNSDDDGEFLLNLVRKHSIILFWITVSTVAFTVAFLAAFDFVGATPRMLDNTVNAVAVFLSFSVNEGCYIRCGCHLCAQRVDQCLRALSHRGGNSPTARDSEMEPGRGGTTAPPIQLDIELVCTLSPRSSGVTTPNEMESSSRNQKVPPLSEGMCHMRNNSALSTQQQMKEVAHDIVLYENPLDIVPDEGGETEASPSKKCPVELQKSAIDRSIESEHTNTATGSTASTWCHSTVSTRL